VLIFQFHYFFLNGQDMLTILTNTFSTLFDIKTNEISRLNKIRFLIDKVRKVLNKSLIVTLFFV